MNVAILTVSSIGMVCSAGCLLIMLKGAKEAQALKTEVETVKAKVARNAKIVKAALGAIEL